MDIDVKSWRARRYYTIFAFLVSILLLGWGAFVTSINAGMAVPDWPTSLDSYDPFNPWPEWWKITPVLAEHGHRLLGALVGLFTVGLTIWTWVADDRLWMKRLGVAALVLVMAQGILGGLRVVLVSLDLAVVHAMVAQLYFSLLAAMILFVSPLWARITTSDLPFDGKAVTRFALGVSGAVYFQIFLGALLRHPGTGINPMYATFHISFAVIATIAVVRLWLKLKNNFPEEIDILLIARRMHYVLGVQLSLGIFAYFVLLDERGVTQPSNVQVIINSAHLIVGALLFASTVLLAIAVSRRARSSSSIS